MSFVDSCGAFSDGSGKAICDGACKAVCKACSEDPFYDEAGCGDACGAICDGACEACSEDPS